MRESQNQPALCVSAVLLAIKEQTTKVTHGSGCDDVVSAVVWFSLSSTRNTSWRMYGEAKTKLPQTAGIMNAIK